MLARRCNKAGRNGESEDVLSSKSWLVENLLFFSCYLPFLFEAICVVSQSMS